MKKRILPVYLLLILIFAGVVSCEDEPVAPAPTILAEKIEVSGENIMDGKSSQFSAVVTPANATNKTVVWSVSDPKIASISEDGLLTAKANGMVKVIATAAAGSAIKGEKEVTVAGFEVQVSGITVEGQNIEDGGTSQMTASVLPADATNKEVSWSVSDESIASVSASGLLTAKSDGSVTVTATAKDGSEATGNKEIIISGYKIPVASLSIAGGNITDGGTSQMTASVLPADATNQEVSWSVSDNSVATIDENGLLTATGNGTVVVTATASDGSGVSVKKDVSVNGLNGFSFNGKFYSVDEVVLSRVATEVFGTKDTTSTIYFLSPGLDLVSDENGNINARYVPVGTGDYFTIDLEKGVQSGNALMEGVFNFDNLIKWSDLYLDVTATKTSQTQGKEYGYPKYDVTSLSVEKIGAEYLVQYQTSFETLDGNMDVIYIPLKFYYKGIVDSKGNWELQQ